VTGAGGVELATYNLGGHGPPVLLLHATGFHGRCWLPLAPALSPTFTVWAMDQRGHGSSGKSPDGRYDWTLFAEDTLNVVDALGGGPWRGVGHSLGGGALLRAEADRPGTFVSICCYEPVVISPSLHRATQRQGPNLADLARRRRPSFASRQAAWDNYASKPPFANFHPDALHAYVDYGFVDAPDGTVTLACTREDEASVFDGAASSGAWEALPRVRPPVAVLGGSDPDDPIGRIIEEVARMLPRGGARRFDELDHFGPLVDPLGVGAVMAQALKESTIDVPPPS
jgi:pimeloyl-ACP methyl ester carboxylesterase